MQGTIFVAAYMAAEARARSDRKRWEHRQRQLAIRNALWAYHRAKDKQATVRQFAVEFAWLNQHN